MAEDQRRILFLAGLALSFILVLPTQSALAHTGQPPEPHDIWLAWNGSPSLFLALLAAAVLYARGFYALHQHQGSARRNVRWRALAFALGMLALVVALISPIDALGSALFSGHMVQHMLLILLAAPLLALGAPLGPILLALPLRWGTALGGAWKHSSWLRRGWRLLSSPGAVWGLHAAALWLWHVPAAYGLALRTEWVHWLQHFSFLSTALLFWWVVLHPRGRPGLTRGPGGALFIFTMALQSGLLGALLTFSPQPWYPAYLATTPPWGLMPLEDQQLAGAIMWIPAGMVYVVAAVGVLGAWFYAMEQETIQSR